MTPITDDQLAALVAVANSTEPRTWVGESILALAARVKADGDVIAGLREEVARSSQVLEDLVINYGMGWELDNVVERATPIVRQYQDSLAASAPHRPVSEVGA